MKQILSNLALIHLITFCKEHNIDPSDTHLYKYPRRWTYSLLRNTDGLAVMTLTFHKNQIPTYSFNKS